MPHPLVSRRLRSGFTLIELLVVIAIIALLASITLGVAAGVNNQQARARASAQMQALMSALEDYRAAYGDYPRVLMGTNPNGGANELARALLLGADLDGSVPRDSEGEPVRRFISWEDFDLTGTESDPTGILDPFGRNYVYNYGATGTAWDRPGFILLSAGSDGQVADPDGALGTGGTGILGTAFEEAEENLDNIMSRE